MIHLVWQGIPDYSEKISRTTLENSIGGKELIKMFEKISLTENDFRGDRCIRLKKINQLVSDGLLTDELKWK